jgi:hypothetical protein
MDFLVRQEQNKLLEKEMEKRSDAKIKVEVERWTKFEAYQVAQTMLKKTILQSSIV